MGLARIELATSSLSGMRSNRLSYSPGAETSPRYPGRLSRIGWNVSETEPSTSLGTIDRTPIISYEGLLNEWESDWKLAGRSVTTIRNYVYAMTVAVSSDDLDLATVKAWIAEGAIAEQQRFRGRSARGLLALGHR